MDRVSFAVIGCAIEAQPAPGQDLIVEEAVVVELKSVERFDPVFEAQIPMYLRVTGPRVDGAA